MKTVPSFVLVAFILANGRHSTTAEECDQNENMLAPGRWYQYGFDIRAEAASVGSTNDVSDMNLACRVRVSHIGNCKYLFQVQQCTFSSGGGPPGSKELWIEHDDLSELAKFPVVVSLSKGVVNGLKVSPSEPEHFLNIKRALISAFVLRKSHMTEGAELQRVDIHGTCPWKMWPGADAGTAHSSKDMLYCAYPERPDWNLSPWAFMWNLHFVQYLINSTVECTYHASPGSRDHLESLYCHERHAIKLESTHDTTTAVQTNVFYKMSLESQGVIETPASDFGDLLDLVPAGIAFKHLPAPDPTLANFEGDEKSRLDEATRDKLAELVLTAETEIKLFTIPLFHEFVELLRKSNDLVDFVESVANCNSKPDNVDVGEKFCTGKWKMLAMSFLQDALIQSNTVPAMRAFRHLVAHGHVNRAYLPLAFHSWSFLRNNDTRYLEEVFEICKSTEHKMCWLLAGRMIRKYHANNVDKNTVPPISVTVIRHMSAFLGSKCDIDAVSYPAKYSKPQKMDHLVVMLKALKNAGSAVQVANPVLEQILLACAQNGDLPIPVAVFAVEAVQEFPLLAYDTRLAARELLVDRARPWELRMAVYKLLTRGPDRWKLGMAVSSALAQEPRHSELVDYAVSDFLDSLPKELRTALQEGQFDTDSVIPGEKFYASDKHYGSSTGGSDQPRKSGRRSYERRVRLPFMPPELSGFAVKVDSEEIFGGWKNLLPDLSRNVTLQLFGTEFHFADVTVFFKEIEQLVLSVARLSEGEWRPDWDVFLDLLKPWGGSSRLKRPLKHFPELQTGLKKILDLTPPVGRMSLTPLVDLNMFGTDLTFSSYGEILVALASAFVPPEPLDQFLRQPRSFDVVRTIRIIEGYHQVPTMLGLPLNWTTSATLVASLRSEASYTGQGNINVKLHPSGALTFLNRMLLDFPTKTRIGVQANSSAYTSTQLSAVANLQRESARLEVHIPQGEQKILQLVRTNQLIKHDRFEEMGDWNVQRVNVDWCTGGGLGRATGLQLCHDRSYANVTHLMRPWFLMAAPASWQLVLRPYSEDISSVVVAAVIPSRNKQFRIDVLTKGVTEKTQLTLQSQENGGLVAFVPDAPFLRAAMTKESVGEDPDASNAVVTEYALGYAPGQQVVLTYRDLAKEEKRQKPAKETNRFLNSEVTVGVRQRSLTLRAGSSSYGLSWKTNTQPTGVKQELRINFEGGPDGPATWLRDVVADEFFTKDGSGGWAHLLYHWKAPTTIGRHKVAHSSHGHIATPKTVLDLASYFLESGSRQLTQINLTKVEKGTQRLLAFANYTQEHWRHVKGDVARRSARYNLTVSHHSWALHFDEESRKSTAEVIGQIRLLSERMRRRQDNWGFFSTWWHPSTSHLFEAELGKTELLWSTRPVRSSRKDPGRTALEATLRHHSGDSEPFSLQLLGNVTLLPSGLEADWLLGSADSDLRWEAHSRILGLVEKSALPGELTYRYTLHYKGKPFGTYRLQVRSSDKPCLTWELRHNVTSEPWLYTSNVSYACDPLTHGTSAAKAYMNLTVFSASPVWKLLDTDLKQVFEFGPTGYESMNMSSGLGDVTVKGRWDAHSYVKEAKFSNTHMDWIPVELFFNVEKRGWIFDAKYRPHSTSHGIRVISVSKRSVRSGAATIYDAKLITNRQELDPYAQEQSLFQVVVVPREGDTVVMALMNEPATQSLLTVAGATAARGMRDVVAALYDPGHPVHRMLHPLTGGTPLGELADMQRCKAQDFLAKVWTTSAEVLGSFHSIYEPVLYTGSGLFRKAAVASGLAEAAFRQTIPGWAFYYFHLDWVLAHTVSHAPQLSAKVAKMYFTTPSEVPGITEVSAHVPRLLSYDHIRKHIGGVFQEHRAHSWTLPRLEKGQRVAAIFGVGHVVTFDGVFLEFPSYPASYCTYLLSTVVGGRLFTVATSAEDLLVEFPEVTISILGKEGRVAVNAGDAPVHLPLVLASGKVSVYREGHLVRVRGHGLAVYCDVAKFFCTFVLDRSVHGTLLGILGDADGNPNNDDELPDGATAQDAAQLAAGYELSGNAECRALVNPVRSAPVSGAAKYWQQVPQALKRCLTETKNEELFHEACSWDLSHRSSPCTSINAMAAYCTHHGYWVPDNLHCDHCHNSSEAAGKKSFRLKSAPILEVVVLLAESSFEPRVATSVLAGTQRLVDAVDAAFKARGHDTKFAFVLNGGGEGPHYRNPHLRTGAKDVFVPHVSAAGKLLKSIGRSSSRSVTTDLGLTLGYALDTVPFSAEAARVVLAIAASDFNCSRHELDQLHEKTHRSGVTVYAFSHYPTVDQRGRVFGVRADGLVFPESTAGEEYLDYPSRAGLLAKLAAATKGSAFQVQFVEAGLPAQFFEVVAQEIFAKVGKEARGCRDCTCERGRAWGSVARCRPVGC